VCRGGCKHFWEMCAQPTGGKKRFQTQKRGCRASFRRENGSKAGRKEVGTYIVGDEREGQDTIGVPSCRAKGGYSPFDFREVSPPIRWSMRRAYIPCLISNQTGKSPSVKLKKRGGRRKGRQVTSLEMKSAEDWLEKRI